MPKVDCSELSKTITRIALNIGARSEIKNLDHVAAEMQKVVPEINRSEIVKAIVEATTGHARDATDLQKKLGELKREAKNDVALRQSIANLEKNLAGGTLPARRPAAPGAPPATMTLRESRDALLSAVRKSTPAIRERFEKQIGDLSARLNATDFAPPMPREEIPLTKDLARLQYQRDRLRSQINQRISDLKPKGIWTHIAEPFNAARAIMTSMDLSAVFRQGGIIALSHPVRAAQSIGPMLRAFASDQTSHRINTEILDRPNAPLYAKSKLYLSPMDNAGPLSAKEENFMSHWVQKIPGVKNSERAYNTFLNKLRADSFDTMTATLARNGEPTLPESQAIANYINIATGRGKLGASIEQAAVPLNTVFFAPRYVASRFQFLVGQPLIGGTGRTRAMVAGEYGKFAVGAGAALALGVAAGATVETDPRSSDFLKLKFGNTRVDMFAGLAQVITFTSRVLSGQTKSSTTGKVSDIRGKGVKFGGQDTSRVITNFVRSKLSPMAGTAWDVATGTDAIGQPIGATDIAQNLAIPMTFKDTYDAIQDQGVPKGAAFGLASMFGMGVQTYDKKKKRMSRAGH